jgi:hypothetical protein
VLIIESLGYRLAAEGRDLNVMKELDFGKSVAIICSIKDTTNVYYSILYVSNPRHFERAGKALSTLLLMNVAFDCKESYSNQEEK